MSIYNAGYQFYIKCNFKWEDFKRIPEGLRDFIIHQQLIALQPESFFNDNYANGEAHFEQYTNIGNKPESKTLPIRRAGDSFVLYVEDRISELKNMIK